MVKLTVRLTIILFKYKNHIINAFYFMLFRNESTRKLFCYNSYYAYIIVPTNNFDFCLELRRKN